MYNEQDVVDGGEVKIVEEPCVTRGQIVEDPLRAGVLVCDEAIPLGERFMAELVCTSVEAMELSDPFCHILFHSSG